MKEETKVVIGMIVSCLLIFAGIVFFGSDSSSSQNSAALEDQSILVREDSQKIEAPEAKVMLVEFLDFECEACGAAYPTVKKILEEYKGKITFVQRNFPLHGNSVLAAKSAEAAGEQGRFWEMYSKLFENQKEWGEKQTPQTALFQRYAQEIGLDMTAFNEVIKSTKYEDKIARDKQDGIKAGVQGTPTFFLNGQKLKASDYASLKQLIDKEINK